MSGFDPVPFKFEDYLLLCLTNVSVVCSMIPQNYKSLQ